MSYLYYLFLNLQPYNTYCGKIPKEPPKTCEQVQYICECDLDAKCSWFAFCEDDSRYK